MKLLYMTNVRIPTEKAHGLQIIKMCEAFQKLRIPIQLFVPTRLQSDRMKQVSEVWTHYDVETPFPLTYLLTPDFLFLERLIPQQLVRCLYHAQCLLFSLIAIIVTCFERDGIYYSRSLETMLVLGLTKPLHRKKVYFEAHELHGDPHRTGILPRLFTRVMRWMLRHIDGLIVITSQLRRCYAEIGIDERKILVAPDGIDARRLSCVFSRSEARQKLQIPLDKKVICYTGHLFKWKGVYTLAESSHELPDDCVIYVVGGIESDILAFRQFIAERHLKNIVVTGYVPYAEIPLYLQAADVLVLPNTARARIAREYTSPLKLFEYMAAQRPIVASDLPAIREVLRHGENACLVQPDNPAKLAEGILKMLRDKPLAESCTKTAYVEVRDYTWEKRAEQIVTFLTYVED